MTGAVYLNRSRKSQIVGTPVPPTISGIPASASLIVDELEKFLLALEGLGAFVAAAHVEAAIEACCKQFEIERKSSKSD